MSEWDFPMPRYALLDIWMALGGRPQDFEVWVDAPRRTPADAWAQLCAAIRRDIATLFADTNPPAGDELLALLTTRREDVL